MLPASALRLAAEWYLHPGWITNFNHMLNFCPALIPLVSIMTSSWLNVWWWINEMYKENLTILQKDIYLGNIKWPEHNLSASPKISYTVTVKDTPSHVSHFYSFKTLMHSCVLYSSYRMQSTGWCEYLMYGSDLLNFRVSRADTELTSQQASGAILVTLTIL